MKSTGRTFLSLLLALGLVVFGFLWGARKGWQGEADALSGQYAAEGGLQNLLELRAADASNLLKVAGRYLTPQDSAYAAVASARDVLRNSKASLPQKFAANQALTGAVSSLAAALRSDSAFTQSVRDQNYLTSLSQALASYNESAAAQAYNQAAEGFNRRKDASLSGMAASLLGVSDAPLFAAP